MKKTILLLGMFVCFLGNGQTLQEMEEIAESGDKGAQYHLGLKYYRGEGTYQNYAKASYWFEKLATQGHKDAQFYLGLMYFDGDGVDQDYSKAEYWYQKSAEQGNLEAQHNLGVI